MHPHSTIIQKQTEMILRGATKWIVITVVDLDRRTSPIKFKQIIKEKNNEKKKGVGKCARRIGTICALHLIQSIS